MGEVIALRGVKITIEPHLERLTELATLAGYQVIETYVEDLRRELANSDRAFVGEITVTLRPSRKLLEMIEREQDLIEIEILGEGDLG